MGGRMWGLAALLALGVACDKKHDHGSHDKGGTVAVPDHYKDAVAKCEELSNKIGGLIAGGKLGEVHAVAADIRKIAEKLPEMAQKDQPPAEMLKLINVKSKELAGMFDEIDKAADSGNKEETIRLHEKMKDLIADLKVHSGHAKDHHD